MRVRRPVPRATGSHSEQSTYCLRKSTAAYPRIYPDEGLYACPAIHHAVVLVPPCASNFLSSIARLAKDRKSNELSASMSDAGCSSQSPISGPQLAPQALPDAWRVRRWPLSMHQARDSPTLPTRRCADRTRSRVRNGLTNPTEDRSWPASPPLPPPTTAARALGRRAAARWIRRCGRGSSSRCGHR